MKKHLILIMVVFFGLMIVLPGIAIARNATPTDAVSSPSDQGAGAALTGGKYKLSIQPAPAASDNSTSIGNTVISSSQMKPTSPTGEDVLQGGSYQLRSPGGVNQLTGCCCKNLMPCIRKK